MDSQVVNLKRREACLAAAVLVLLLLFLIFYTCYDIHVYSQKPVAVSGKLEKVELQYQRYLALQVNGERYLIYKSPYTDGTFGIIMNFNRMELLSVLKQKVGLEAHIAYVDPDSKHKGIVNLIIDDVKYVDRQGAVSDYIAEQQMTRMIGVALLVLVLGCFLLVIKGKAR